MKLETWLEKNDMSVNDFAKAIDCTACTVFQWRREAYRPSKYYMKIIKEFTKGEVTSKDFKKRVKNGE